MAGYHINDNDVLMQCTATVQDCKYRKMEGRHFDDADEAERGFTSFLETKAAKEAAAREDYLLYGKVVDGELPDKTQYLEEQVVAETMTKGVIVKPFEGKFHSHPEQLLHHVGNYIVSTRVTPFRGFTKVDTIVFDRSWNVLNERTRGGGSDHERLESQLSGVRNAIAREKEDQRIVQVVVDEVNAEDDPFRKVYPRVTVDEDYHDRGAYYDVFNDGEPIARGDSAEEGQMLKRVAEAGYLHMVARSTAPNRQAQLVYYMEKNPKELYEQREEARANVKRQNKLYTQGKYNDLSHYEKLDMQESSQHLPLIEAALKTKAYEHQFNQSYSSPPPF